MEVAGAMREEMQAMQECYNRLDEVLHPLAQLFAIWGQFMHKEAGRIQEDEAMGMLLDDETSTATWKEVKKVLESAKDYVQRVENRGANSYKEGAQFTSIVNDRQVTQVERGQESLQCRGPVCQRCGGCEGGERRMKKTYFELEGEIEFRKVFLSRIEELRRSSLSDAVTETKKGGGRDGENSQAGGLEGGEGGTGELD